MGQKLRVLFVASEGVPFAKTGGLADIVGTLPQALEELGAEVKVLMPYYGMVKQGKVPTTLIAEDLEVNLGLIKHTFNLMAPAAPGSPFYFVERDEFYERSQLYGTPRGDYFDNLERFAFLSGAVLPFCRALDFAPPPDSLPRLAERPGAGLPPPPLGRRGYPGRGQNRVHHS